MKGKLTKEHELNDKTWSFKVKERDHFKCQWCGRKDKLTSDHIFSRKKLNTRWNVDNGITLCAGCHIFRKRYEPFEWALVVIKKVGMPKLLELYDLHNGKKWTV